MLPWYVPILLADPDSDKLVITTAVPVDDQFSTPKQIRWSSALGKLLVANSGTNIIHARNSDLSYSSKYLVGYSAYGADTDGSFSFLLGGGTVLRKHNLDLSNGVMYLASLALSAGGRMIDASGDPLHIYVSSNNAADGHGIRMVTKSTMAVTGGGTPVQILATGTGDNQFTNPLGLLYIATNADSGFLYVCEATRICKIAVVTTAGSESFTWTTSYAIAANDLAWNGTNFYVQSSTQTIKYDNVFTDATKVATACVGYSITYIPDQSDGYGATLAIVDSTNSHLERRKCSDLSAINSVGSAGDGSSSLFDPTFTTSVATQIEYKFDDGFSYVTPSGTSHAISWNGFAGYSFRSAGPHKCTVTVRGGLGLVTGIDCNTDAMVSVRNLNKLNITGNLYLQGNGATIRLNLSDLPRTIPTYISLYDIPSAAGIVGPLSSCPNAPSIYLANTRVSGALSALWNSSILAHLYGCTGITPASIAHLIVIRDLRIYSMGWSAAQNTTVLLSAWAARAAYTYASGIALRISAPTGTPGTEPPAAGESNSDWGWNAETSRHDPLTGYAAMADLQNDFYSEGFKAWVITIV